MRQSSRIAFRAIRVKVYDRQSDSMLGYIADISAGGLRLAGDELMLPGARYALQLRMRDSSGEIIAVDVDADCQWSQANPRTGNIDSGFAVQLPNEAFTQLVSNMKLRRGRRVRA